MKIGFTVLIVSVKVCFLLFFESLAKAYFSQIYLQEVEKICAERGEMSDDGDKIVDKHSGYLIKMIEFDTSEGYDETGYKIVSNAVLQEDIGDVLMKSAESSKIMSGRGLMIKKYITNFVKTNGC